MDQRLASWLAACLLAGTLFPCLSGPWMTGRGCIVSIFPCWGGQAFFLRLAPSSHATVGLGKGGEQGAWKIASFTCSTLWTHAFVPFALKDRCQESDGAAGRAEGWGSKSVFFSRTCRHRRPSNNGRRRAS
ncbi:hypothetical protein IWZ01DRAFT_170789 [Phyllosticta capitalensis]